MAVGRITQLTTSGPDPEETIFKLDPTKLREYRLSPVDLGTSIPGNIQQIQALRDCKQFLTSLLLGDEASMDPARLLPTVCRALGESGTDAQLIAQAGVTGIES